jgi:hypothetical protein
MLGERGFQWRKYSSHDFHSHERKVETRDESITCGNGGFWLLTCRLLRGFLALALTGLGLLDCGKFRSGFAAGAKVLDDEAVVFL